MNEAELLFTDVLNCSRISLYLNRNLLLNKDESTFISSALKRRISGEPIQYILGKTEFMGLEFKVTPDVFIPRPETEALVETAINLVKSLKFNVKNLNILDIGTGSGCIAISLAKLLPNATITATDISQKAIEIAQYNATLNNVAKKIGLIKSDLFTSQELRVMRYDIIVSNPPYVATSEIETLQPEIRRQPRIAIDAGKDGLDFYRSIIEDSPVYLKENGFLIIEMGFNQKNLIKNIFQDGLKKYKIIDIIKDYSNIDRVIVAKRDV